MKSRYGLMALMVSALIVAIVSPCLAQADDAKKVTLTGSVSVTLNDEKEVTAISVLVGEVEYRVNLDKKGLELAGLDGRKVEVTGTVVEKDKVKTLTVLTFKAIEEEEDWGDGGEM